MSCGESLNLNRCLFNSASTSAFQSINKTFKWEWEARSLKQRAQLLIVKAHSGWRACILAGLYLSLVQKQIKDSELNLSLFYELLTKLSLEHPAVHVGAWVPLSNSLSLYYSDVKKQLLSPETYKIANYDYNKH